MSYHHLTAIERGKIEELNKLGLSSLEIAEQAAPYGMIFVCLLTQGSQG